MPDVSSLRAALLDWYDAHARTLPWRAPPGSGTRTEPYRVWLSEVMLQQTTVPHAAPYFERFTTRWPTVSDLAAAPDADLMAAWAGLGYYARARNLLACARAVASEHGGVFPDTEAGLLSLPGVGAYTAAAVQSGYLLNSWCNYTHQQSLLQYPAVTAMEKRMTSAFGNTGAFYTVQHALQFFPEDAQTLR